MQSSYMEISFFGKIESVSCCAAPVSAEEATGTLNVAASCLLGEKLRKKETR